MRLTDEEIGIIGELVAERARKGAEKKACFACAHGVSGSGNGEAWTICLLTGDDVCGVCGMDCFEECEWE